ncbi:uncharacterized protein [Choristoneura fumiferana]|uniref:uncharacterized protein n=1 Tax=Choristoneura fumiferana TaxID=7141 RepID=UPI003D157D28
MVWIIIFNGILLVALLTVFFTCGLVCVKLFSPELEIVIEDDEEEEDFFPVPRRLLEDVEPSYETAHITRDSLRYQDTSEDRTYDEMDMYLMSIRDSLTSSDKGNTTDDHTDSNPVEDAVKDENDDASGSQNDSGIKSNADDHKPTNPKEKSGDN